MTVYMKFVLPLLTLLCLAAVLGAGCTVTNPQTRRIILETCVLQQCDRGIFTRHQRDNGHRDLQCEQADDGKFRV